MMNKDNLPEEVLRLLQRNKKLITVEDKIVNILTKYGDCTLNDLIIHLYNEYKYIPRSRIYFQQYLATLRKRNNKFKKLNGIFKLTDKVSPKNYINTIIKYMSKGIYLSVNEITLAHNLNEISQLTVGKVGSVLRDNLRNPEPKVKRHNKEYRLI